MKMTASIMRRTRQVTARSRRSRLKEQEINSSLRHSWRPLCPQCVGVRYNYNLAIGIRVAQMQKKKELGGGKIPKRCSQSFVLPWFLLAQESVCCCLLLEQKKHSHFNIELEYTFINTIYADEQTKRHKQTNRQTDSFLGKPGTYLRKTRNFICNMAAAMSGAHSERCL